MRPPPLDAGDTSHRKVSDDSGMTDVASSKARPGSTEARRIWCRPPALVCISPLVPVANGPFSDMDSTSGFHSGQVDVSDQMVHTRSGEAVVARKRTCAA